MQVSQHMTYRSHSTVVCDDAVVIFSQSCLRAMSHDSRSTKRRRTSDDSNPRPILIVAPGEWFKPTQAVEVFTRHADFWLDDGNLILLAGATAFRVFRSILVKKSVVFADMFATGSPDATESFDNCPIVRLPDHPEDLRDFLQYLMPCSPLK